MTQLLKDILFNGRTNRLVREGRVVLLWEKVVAAEIARQTEAYKMRNRILYVKTKSPVWAQELNFVKPEIIKRLNEKAGFEAVRDIHFKAGE